MYELLYTARVWGLNPTRCVKNVVMVLLKLSGVTNYNKFDIKVSKIEKALKCNLKSIFKFPNSRNVSVPAGSSSRGDDSSACFIFEPN